jgi:hypothetical protein
LQHNTYIAFVRDDVMTPLPRSSRDYVGAESWVEIGGGYTEFAGFPVVHQKTTGFLGW